MKSRPNSSNLMLSEQFDEGLWNGRVIRGAICRESNLRPIKHVEES
jgi:hypothetical protein